MRCFSECKGSLIVAKGQTYKERLFLRKVAEGYYIVREDGTIFNTHTGRYVGDRENVNLYPNISLRDTDQKTYTLSRHVLVWLVFKGDIPYDLEINHIDGNKQNTRLDNLELVTNQGNKAHAWDTGLARVATGENHAHAKMTNAEVIYYRNLINGKIQNMEERLDWVEKLSKKFNSRPQNIRQMLDGTLYKHVGGKIASLVIQIRVDKELKIDIIETYKKLRNIDLTATEMKLSAITVKKHIPKDILKKYPPIRKNGFDEDTKKWIMKMSPKMPIQVMADKLGCNYNKIYNFIRNNA